MNILEPFQEVKEYETGLVTPSGVTSVPVGMETPDMIELRKKRIEDAMEQGGDTSGIYKALPEKNNSVGDAMMGSTHVYDRAAVRGIQRVLVTFKGGISRRLYKVLLHLNWITRITLLLEMTLRKSVIFTWMFCNK